MQNVACHFVVIIKLSLQCICMAPLYCLYIVWSAIHLFIHCRNLYSASSRGTTQKRAQPQRGQIMLF